MDLTKKTPSLMGKIASLLLLIIGAVLIGSNLPQLYRYGFIDLTTILTTIFGIAIIWGGAKLWPQWCIALGVISFYLVDQILLPCIYLNAISKWLLISLELLYL